MYPDLFTFPQALPLVGGQTVSSFGAFVSLAFVASGLIFEWGVRRQGGDTDQAWNIVLLAFAGGIIGAKLYWVLWHMDSFARDPSGTLFSGSGLTWYGGFILAVAMVAWGIRAMKMPVGETFDATALALPVGIAVGRIGCFLVGDDYGRPTASPVGVAFPDGAPPTTVQVFRDQFNYEVDPAIVAQFGEVVPVHPTQLYEVALSLIVFGIVFSRRDHTHKPGWLFAFWLGLYAVQRFLIEIVRIKDDRIIFGLSGAQLISIAMLGAALYIMNQRSGPVVAADTPGGAKQGGGGGGKKQKRKRTGRKK
jgi:phosphatidylglycerol:prolipoprotein diacylglycerol transferase